MENQTQTEKPIENTERYLNIYFRFPGSLTIQDKEKLLKRISKKMRILISDRLKGILDVNEIGISYILKSNPQFCHFKDFKISNVLVSAKISACDEGTVTHQIEELSLTNPETDEEEIVVSNEEDLLTNLKLLSKESYIDKVDFMPICKRIVQKGPNKTSGMDNEFDCYELDATIDEMDKDGKPISHLQYPLSDIEINLINENSTLFFETFNKCYCVDCSQTRHHIECFNSSKSKKIFKNFESKDYDVYSSITAYIASDPSLEVVTEDGVNVTVYKFVIQDDDSNRIVVKTTDNLSFYRNLKPIFKSKVKLYGYFRLIKGYPQFELHYMKILQLGIIATKYKFKISGGREYYFVNEKDGLFLRAYNQDGDMGFEQRFTEKPIQITGFFINSEDILLYGLKLGGAEYFGSIEAILEDLKNGRQNEIVCKENLDEAVMNIVRQITRDQNVNPTRVHTWSGVYTDENGNLEIVIPQTHKIIPENYIQHRIIEYMKRARIIIPKDVIREEWKFKRYSPDEMIEIKKSLEFYYNVWTFPGIKDIHKIVTFGHTVSTPYFKILSKNKNLDVYPGHFSVGPKGAGKTTLLRLVCEYFYCVPECKGNDITSESRLKDYLSGSTWLQMVDEIDAISKSKNKDGIIIFLKAALTSMADTGRKTPSQQWIMTQMNCTLAGTANTIQWLNDDSAFKEGRSILSQYSKSNSKYRAAWQELERPVKSEKFTRIGFFFTRESIEFIRKWGKNSVNPGETPPENDLSSLIKLINCKKEIIQRTCDKFHIRLSDPRRNTINALILVGLEFWRYVFHEYLDRHLDLIENYLNEDSPQLAEFIKQFEKANFDSKLEDVYQLLAFIESSYNYQDVDQEVLIDRPNNIIYLSNRFLARYNEFAQKAGFRKYSDLPELAEILNDLTNDVEIDPNSRIRWPSKHQQRAIPIYYQKLFDETIPDAVVDQNKKTDFFEAEQTKLNTETEIQKQSLYEKMKEMLKENPEPIQFDDIVAATEGKWDSKKIEIILKGLIAEKKIYCPDETHYQLTKERKAK